MRLPQTVLHPDFCNVTALQDIVKIMPLQETNVWVPLVSEEYNRLIEDRIVLNV